MLTLFYIRPLYKDMIEYLGSTYWQICLSCTKIVWRVYNEYPSRNIFEGKCSYTIRNEYRELSSLYSLLSVCVSQFRSCPCLLPHTRVCLGPCISAHFTHLESSCLEILDSWQSQQMRLFDSCRQDSLVSIFEITYLEQLSFEVWTLSIIDCMQKNLTKLRRMKDQNKSSWVAVAELGSFWLIAASGCSTYLRCNQAVSQCGHNALNSVRYLS